MISASVTVLEGSGSNSLWLSHRLKMMKQLLSLKNSILINKAVIDF
jgi:hypothetical protein